VPDGAAAALPFGWTNTTLGELIALQRGFDLPAARRRPGPYPVVSSGGISGSHDAGPVPGPGLAIGRASNLGAPVWSQGDYWPLNTTLFVKDFRGNDPRFVYYLLQQLDLTPYNSGSVQPMLNRNYVAAVALNIPPPTEQAAIAAWLRAYDDKIESNQRKISVIHELAAAWCQSFLGTPTQRWTEAWPECRLDEVLSTLEVGRRPSGGIKHEPDGIPSIGAESIVRAGSFDFSKTKRVSEAFFTGMRRGHVEHLDVLLYKDGGTPGNFIPHVSAVGHGFPFAVASINEHVYRLRIRAPYTGELSLLLVVESPPARRDETAWHRRGHPGTEQQRCSGPAGAAAPGRHLVEPARSAGPAV
jgi:type I restriction enzyme S subunit